MTSDTGDPEDTEGTDGDPPGEPGSSPLPAWRRSTTMEPRWHVTIAIVIMAGLQITLALTFLKALLRSFGIASAALEVVLAAVLLAANLRGKEHEVAAMRRLSLGLVAVASGANLLSLGALIDQLVSGQKELTASRLLGTGGLVWLTNVIVFALWYWELDGGGPSDRAAGMPEAPSFLYPQQTSQSMFMSWEPRFFDYFYLSWTNATAFSPTDTLPTTGWAKFAMMLQSGISLVTVALVIARAVNILG